MTKTLKGFHDGKPIVKYTGTARLVDKGGWYETDWTNTETEGWNGKGRPGPGWADFVKNMERRRR